MREVVDAKIVRMVYIESCYECPYCQLNDKDGWYCLEMWNSNDKKSIDDCSIPTDNMHNILDNCPLPKAICTITEDVDDEMQ